MSRVRLDFTYGDANNHVARFLQALSDNSFNIMLHLVQPFEAAQKMEEHAAQVEWQQFIKGTLSRFGYQVAMLEVGTTVNRKRWVGYSLRGFLEAWRIAHAETRSKGIKLAGPNITDFEPSCNIGLLAILQAREQLPDVHTDNLFSERCFEPERDDHKILGRRLAALGGFRLVKKAFVLQEIGAHFGVPDLYSPAAFWTLPRIRRILVDAEEKQADYLARYMLLCAASGALQGANWGPLICHREGLIDSGIKQYPRLERITHYVSVTGRDFRLRPAFHAYRTFLSLIPGSHYESVLIGGAGLEVHAFTAPDRLVHVAWTINGAAAALRDIYQESDLRHATCLSRDGTTLSIKPDFVTESPIYLCWNKEYPVQANREAKPISKLAIHAHIDKSHYLYRKDGWRGAVLAENREEAALLMRELDPSRIEPPGRTAFLRKARNAIWTIPDPRNPARKLVIKQPVKMRPHKKLLDRLKPSKGLRSWNGASELLRRGIETARPVAYFEQVEDQTQTQNFYICEYVESDFSARDIFSAFARGEQQFRGIEQHEAYRQLAGFLLGMHGRGVYFRDLSGGNILIRIAADGALNFSLIDTGRAHFYLHGTKLSKRLADLTRVCNKLHAHGRNQFMQLYMEKLGRKFGWRQRLPFHLYNAKVFTKRTLKGKTLKALFRR